MRLNIVPDEIIPIPFSEPGDSIPGIVDTARRAFNTMAFLTQNDLLNNAPRALTTPTSHPVRSESVQNIQQILTAYDAPDVIRTSTQTRDYIKLRLIELSDPRFNKDTTQLKALELLGKLADVAAFSETVNVNVRDRTKEEILEALASKLMKYVPEEDISDAKLISNHE